MAIFVTFSPRHQMLAAGAAMLIVSTFAVANATEAGSAALAAASLPESSVPAEATAPAEDPAPAPSIDERLVKCVAKVVHHEAANQPREGQIAVAHVLVNRVREGFAPDVCAVARQPRQFFNIDRYHPDRDSDTWAAAVDVARAVLTGEAEDHSQGALYFHANWARLDRFFQGRTRVARLEDHDFYR